MPVDEMLGQRLELLERSGQITASARWLTEQIISRVEEEFGVTVDETNAAQFVTHLAMAIARVERGDDEMPIPAGVEEEIRPFQRERDFMKRVVENSMEVAIVLPDAEVSYMTAHLRALIEGEKGDRS